MRDEDFERLEAMAEWGAWDLSPNDAAALKAGVSEIWRLRAENAQLRKALEWYAGTEGSEKFWVVDSKGERIEKFSEIGHRARAALTPATQEGAE